MQGISLYLSAVFAGLHLAAKENRRLVRERSNRVKAEMIVRNGLCEDCFHTTNFTGNNGKADDVVFVRIVLPEDKAVDDLPVMGERMPGSSLNDNVKCGDSKVELYTSKVELCTSKVDLYEARQLLTTVIRIATWNLLSPHPQTYPIQV